MSNDGFHKVSIPLILKGGYCRVESRYFVPPVPTNLEKLMSRRSQNRGHWIPMKTDSDRSALSGAAIAGKIEIIETKTSTRRRPHVMVKVRILKDSTVQVKRRHPKKTTTTQASKKQLALARPPREQHCFR